jgi:hypothetical protein
MFALKILGSYSATSTSLIRILPVVGFSKRVSNRISVVFPTVRFVLRGKNLTRYTPRC